MDDYDRKILKALQHDADRTTQEIADAVGLSATPTARRIRRLKDEGIISRTVALTDPKALGLGVTIFVFIRTNKHEDAWLARFADGVKQFPEVTEFYRMGGDVDYLLKVVVASLEDYDGFYKRLIKVVPLSDVTSVFAMETIKNTTELPVDLIPRTG